MPFNMMDKMVDMMVGRMNPEKKKEMMGSMMQDRKKMISNCKTMLSQMEEKFVK
jgi:hypothetical protein